MRRGFMRGLGNSIVLSATVAVGGLLSATEATGAPAGSGRHDRLVFGFGLCVAGSYIGEVTVVDPPELAGLTFANLNTIGADGTFVTEATVDFSAGGVTPYAFRSGGRGNWQRVGPRELKVTYLHFLFDPTGVLTGFEKIDLVLNFTPGCRSAVSRGATFSVYLPTQDPFGDDPPVFVGKANASLKRMPLE